MSLVIGRRNRGARVVIDYSRDASRSDYLPLPPTPQDTLIVIPVETNGGDMLRAVYDPDFDGRVEQVESVEMSQVVGLDQALQDLANQGGGGGPNTSFIFVNNNGGQFIKVGQPICKNGTEIQVAKSLAPYHVVLGLAAEDSIPGSQLKIQTSGVMVLPAIGWDDVTDSVGGLANGSQYFIDVMGKLTTQSPENSPEYRINVGIALNSTSLLIDLDLAVKL